MKKKKMLSVDCQLLSIFISWGTRTRTRKGRTRICSVTITPYPKLACAFPECGCKGTTFFVICKKKWSFFIKKRKFFWNMSCFGDIWCTFVA